MAVVALHHGRKELLYQVDRCKQVDLEYLEYVWSGYLQDWGYDAGAGVVDEDCWVAVVISDLVPNGDDLRGYAEVGLIEAGVWTCGSGLLVGCQSLYVSLAGLTPGFTVAVTNQSALMAGCNR